MEGVRGRLAKGVAWTTSGRLLANLIGVASTLVLARLLTPADFGLVALATTALAIVSSLTEFSLAAALVQHEAPEPSHYDTVWTLGVCRAVLLALLMAGIAIPLSQFYNQPDLEAIMYVISASTLITGLTSPKVFEWVRKLSFRQDFISSLASKLTGFLVALWIAVAYHSYWALVLGSLAGQIVSLAVSYIIAPYRPRFSFKHARSLFSFSVWLFLGTGVATVNLRFDQLAIGAVLTPSDLGHYSVGDNLAGLPVREATTPLSMVLFPAFAQLRSDPERLRRAYSRAQGALIAIGLPVGVGFALIADPLVALVMGPQWAPAAMVIQALSTVICLQSFTLPFMAVTMAVGNTRLVFVRDLLSLFFKVPLVFWGLFTAGLLGVIVARCAVGVFFIALELILTKRVIQLPILQQLRTGWRSATATLTMSAAVLGLGALGLAQPTIAHIALLVVVGGATYVGSVIGLWHLLGRPDGPEREALMIATQMVSTLRDAARSRSA
jgi:O-antigen/teichoic acid export membrane protein